MMMIRLTRNWAKLCPPNPNAQDDPDEKELIGAAACDGQGAASL